MSLKLFSGCSARLNFFRTIQSEGRFQRWRSASTKADLKEQEKNSGQHRTPYELLGITPEATQTEVREAFFKKAKTLHPDVNPDPEASQEFSKVKEAFMTLKDPTKRLEYNQTHDVELNLEQKAADAEIHWMTRKKVGPRKIWSERLSMDLLRSSALRPRRRANLEKDPYAKIKPHKVPLVRDFAPRTNSRFYVASPDEKDLKKSLAQSFGVIAVLLTLAVFTRPEKPKQPTASTTE